MNKLKTIQHLSAKDLQNYRNDLNLSLKDVSEATGLTEKQIGDIERGRTKNPSFEKICTLNNYYCNKKGVSEPYFVVSLLMRCRKVNHGFLQNTYEDIFSLWVWSGHAYDKDAALGKAYTWSSNHKNGKEAKIVSKIIKQID